jgi:hypothetical protein
MTVMKLLFNKKVLCVVLFILVVLVFDYFSESFNLIFLANKSPEVAIYGSPSVGGGISFG